MNNGLKSRIDIVMSTTITSIVLTLMMPGIISARPANQTPDAQEPTDDNLTLPAIPEVHLSLIEGFDDHASYRESISERLADLERRVNEAHDVKLRAKLLLAYANQILAYELEPACTLKLLRLHDPPAGHNQPQQLRSVFDRVDRVMKQAKDALNGAIEPPDDTGNDIRHTRKSMDILQLFARAQRSFLLDDAEDPSREARRAASGLSALVENNDHTISTAATFWQACIRSRDADPTVVLSRLDYALANVGKSTLPYSFFSRLLRCRMLADHGGYPLSLTLLLQLEEHSREWFIHATAFDYTYRTLSLMRIQTLRAWYEKLPEKTHSEERRWCVKQIQQLIESRFDEDHKPVMRLWPAVPIVAPIPE